MCHLYGLRVGVLLHWYLSKHDNSADTKDYASDAGRRYNNSRGNSYYHQLCEWLFAVREFNKVQQLNRHSSEHDKLRNIFKLECSVKLKRFIELKRSQVIQR